MQQQGVRVACVQLCDPLGASKAQRVEAALARLRRLPPVDLVVLPELWPVGYFAFERYEEEAEPLDGPFVAAMAAVAAERRCHLLAGSFVEKDAQGRLFNTAVLFGPDGQILLTYRKIHVFGYQSRESALLTPGQEVVTASTPLGRVGVSTCYDLRFPELYRRMVDQGVEMILVPAAWPLARLAHWQLLTRARALENQVYLVACNAAGDQGSVRLGGHSLVADPWGEVVAEAGEGEEVLVAHLDLGRLHRIRAEFPVLKDRRL